MPTFEVCIDNITSLKHAYSGSADRIELCSALSEGGLTPTVGFLKVCRKHVPAAFPIFAMIRPRGGTFVYSKDEIDIMEADIQVLKAAGANGFVFGLLTCDNKIDRENCRRLLEVAKPLPVTFHRAFDEIKTAEEQEAGLEEIVELGFHRLLTSGGAETAEKGLDAISRLITQAKGRLIVMPGAGIVPSNLQKILTGTEAKEFHGSAKGPSGDGMVVTSRMVVSEMKNIGEIFGKN